MNYTEKNKGKKQRSEGGRSQNGTQETRKKTAVMQKLKRSGKTKGIKGEWNKSN